MAEIADVILPNVRCQLQVAAEERCAELGDEFSEASWEAEYQQNPIIVGGGTLPIEKLRVLPRWDPSMVRSTVRYDKAGTEGGEGSETAMVLMRLLLDGRFVISDVIHGPLVGARPRNDPQELRNRRPQEIRELRIEDSRWRVVTRMRCIAAR